MTAQGAASLTAVCGRGQRRGGHRWGQGHRWGRGPRGVRRPAQTPEPSGQFRTRPRANAASYRKTRSSFRISTRIYFYSVRQLLSGRSCSGVPRGGLAGCRGRADAPLGRGLASGFRARARGPVGSRASLTPRAELRPRTRARVRGCERGPGPGCPAERPGNPFTSSRPLARTNDPLLRSPVMANKVSAAQSEEGSPGGMLPGGWARGGGSRCPPPGPAGENRLQEGPAPSALVSAGRALHLPLQLLFRSGESGQHRRFFQKEARPEVRCQRETGEQEGPDTETGHHQPLVHPRRS